MNGAQLYLRLIGISLRSQMEYRTSFFFLCFGYFIQTAIEFLAIWALFSRFQSVGGWTLAEVALLYGITDISFAISELSSRGFDSFGNLVRTGDFDSLLLRPRSTALQVAGQDFHLMRLGRLLQGLIVLLWAILSLPVTWGLFSQFLIFVSIIAGVCLFNGLFIMQATLSFWTVETLELMNIFTFGGREAGRYPLSIYNNWFRRFFTFIVPLASMTYFPITLALQHENASFWVGVLSPLLCPLFLLLSLIFWQYGVRHYCSTGS